MALNRTTATYEAHMWAYRDHLRSINRRLAEEYMRQESQHVSAAIEKLVNAAPVAVAIAQLHKSIRCSPVRNFWPVIRETKGMLLVQSTDPSDECPRPWRRTKGQYALYAARTSPFLAVAHKFPPYIAELHDDPPANGLDGW